MANKIKLVLFSVLAGALLFLMLQLWLVPSEYAVDPVLLESQQRLLKKLRYVKAQVLPQSELDVIYQRGFKEGKRLAGVKVVPVEVIKVETERVEVPGPCPVEPGGAALPPSLGVKANLLAAVVRDADQKLYLDGEIGVDLDHAATNWTQHVSFHFKDAKVDFQISKDWLRSPPRWHRGKAAGCGIGATASSGFWPEQHNTVGVGVFCGYMPFAVVK